MHYKEVEIVLEVMNVDIQISGSDCSFHAVATVYELCAGNDPRGNTINFTHTFRDAWREKQSSHFQGKVRPSGIVKASIQIPIFFASAVCQDGEQTLLGASNVNNAIKPAPSLKQFFSMKREP